MQQGPLVAGAGAGGLGSLLASAAWHLLTSEVPVVPPEVRLPPLPLEEATADFYYGLAVGLVLGLCLATVLDLLHLYRQHLLLTLRNRWASLTLSRTRA